MIERARKIKRKSKRWTIHGKLLCNLNEQNGSLFFNPPVTSFKNEYDSIYRDTPNLNSQDQGFLGSIFFPNPVNEKLKTLDISGAVNIGKSKKELGASCFGCSM